MKIICPIWKIQQNSLRLCPPSNTYAHEFSFCILDRYAVSCQSTGNSQGTMCQPHRPQFPMPFDSFPLWCVWLYYDGAHRQFYCTTKIMNCVFLPCWRTAKMAAGSPPLFDRDDDDNDEMSVAVLVLLRLIRIERNRWRRRLSCQKSTQPYSPQILIWHLLREGIFFGTQLQR